MKTVIVPAPGKIEIREVETPAINAYQALVKTEMVALCNATDSKLIAGHFPGVDAYPLALGHENAGIVVAAGEKVRKSNCLFYKHLIFMYFCPIINF